MWKIQKNYENFWWNFKKICTYLQNVSWDLFAKFSSKIVLKVPRVKSVENIFFLNFEDFWEGFGGISRKVWNDFLEILWKIDENWRFLKKYLEDLLEIDTKQNFRTFKKFSVYIKNLTVKFKGNFKNFCRITRKSFEEILEKVQGNFNEIFQIGNLYKVFWKTV